MTRFFLHCNRGDEHHRDYEGAEFPDTEAALKNAVQAAKMIAEEGVELGEDRGHWRLTIADADARDLAYVPLEHPSPKLIIRP